MPSRLFLIVVFAALACGLVGVDARHSLAVVAPAHYEGALTVEQPLEALAKQANRIVVGKVTDVTAFRAPGTIKTRVKIQVDKDVKGKGDASLTLTQEGGSIGDASLNVGDVPLFVKGERVLLLLDGSSEPKLVGSFQGKYALAGSQAYQRGEGKSQSIKSIEDRLSKALNKTVDLPEGDAEVTSLAFTTYCDPWSTSDVAGFNNGSWVPTPDADLAVGLEVNPANPGSGGPTGTNFSRVVYNEVHNWQALTTSYPSFSYLGTTSRDGTNHLDGHNTVAWANLGSGGTLGVNYCSTLGGSRIDADTLVNNTTYTWDWDDSNGITSTSYSLQAVLEHELGHGLGLGHSDQTCDGSPSTPLMCPAVSNGSRKSITADDSSGAASRYPISGSPPGVPGSVILTPGSGSNTISWTASTGSPLAYDIERHAGSCASGTFVSIGTVDSRTPGYNATGSPIATSAVTSFVDNDFGAGLTAGTYCYRVKALGVGGDSGYGVASQLSSCTAPVITNDTDTDSVAGGVVTFDWSAVSGATSYRVSRKQGSSWVVVTTVAGTTYSGPDAADDPQWRVYVATGTCTPIPGPATVFDPDGAPPPPTCVAPSILGSSDTDSVGAGTVAFNWSPVNGATSYRLAQRHNGAWVVVATVSGTSYSGADQADDPQWRVYVATGTCVPAPGPSTVFDPDGPPLTSCVAPTVNATDDTDTVAGGTVTFSWDAVTGADTYRIAERQNGAWVVMATTAGTSYSGADAADDPQWRIYVATGTCVPAPGPSTVFDP